MIWFLLLPAIGLLIGLIAFFNDYSHGNGEKR
jgi:hypothetical protein